MSEEPDKDLRFDYTRGFPFNVLDLYRVRGKELRRVPRAAVQREATLQQMLVGNPEIVCADMILLDTVGDADGPAIDILALDANGVIQGFELKRQDAPFAVVEQVKRYESQIRELTVTQIHDLYRKRWRKNLADEFYRQFGEEIPDVLNHSRVITVVAASLTRSTALGLAALEREDFAVSVRIFNAFEDEKRFYLSFTNDVGPKLFAARATYEPVPAPKLELRTSELGRLIGDLRLELARLRRKPATPSAPIVGVEALDPHLLCFWLLYEPKFEWDFLPSRFLTDLYLWWRETEAAAGARRPDYPDRDFGHLEFGKRLAAVVTATGNWRYCKSRLPDHLMSAYEPLEELVPRWNRAKTMPGFERIVPRRMPDQSSED